MCRWVSYTVILLTCVPITQQWLWWKGSDDWDGYGGCGSWGCNKGCGHHQYHGGGKNSRTMNHHHHTMVIIERKHKSWWHKIFFWWWPWSCKNLKPVVVKTCADSWCASHDNLWDGGDCKRHRGHKGWHDDDHDDHWYKKRKKKSSEHHTHHHHHDHDCGHWSHKVTHHHVHHGPKKCKEKHKPMKKRKKKKKNHDIIIVNDGDHWDSWDSKDHWDSWGHGDHEDVWAWVDNDEKSKKKGLKGSGDKFDRDVENYIDSVKDDIGVNRKDVSIVNGVPMETKRINQLARMKSEVRLSTIDKKGRLLITSKSKIMPKTKDKQRISRKKFLGIFPIGSPG